MKKIIVVLIVVLLSALAIVSRYPAGHKVNAEEEKLQAKSFALVTENGEILKANNENKRLPVASMVKTMALLLTFEEIAKGNLSEEGTTVATANAASMGGSQVFIEEGTEYKIKDLIKAVVIASGNDAAVLLAETIAGSEQEFVAKMNARALELGLTNTNFENPTGLPSANGFSSALDMAKIMCELKKHKKYFEYAQIWLDQIEHSKGRVTELANTNKLIRQYKNCIGGKTGSTSEAGFCVNAVAAQNGLDLVAVVIGSETSKLRFEAAKQLFNFGFANYENKTLIRRGDKFKIAVDNSREKELTALAQGDYNAVVKKGDKSEFSTVIISKNPSAPVKKNAIVGEVGITKNGELLAKIALAADSDVKAISYFGSLKEILDDFT